MRARFVVLLGAIAVLGACDKSTTPVSPATTADDVVDLIPDYAVSPAASIDAAGIGGSLLPDALKLTAEQKAAITGLHDAFMKATAADIAALQAIEQEARTADHTVTGAAFQPAASLSDSKTCAVSTWTMLPSFLIGKRSMLRVARPLTCVPSAV